MPTDAEREINRAIMRGCNHDDAEFATCSDGEGTYIVAQCRSCEASRIVHGPGGRAAAEHLAELIPPHCADRTMIRRVVREIESRGWRLTFVRHDATWQHFLTNGGLRLDGAPQTGELASLVDLVVRFARSWHREAYTDIRQGAAAIADGQR